MNITIAAPRAPQARRVPTLGQRVAVLSWRLFEAIALAALAAGLIVTAERIAQSVERLS